MRMVNTSPLYRQDVPPLLSADKVDVRPAIGWQALVLNGLLSPKLLSYFERRGENLWGKLHLSLLG